MTLLSKSKYLNGLQCLKYFWVSLHEKDRLPEHDLATQHLFDQGHKVGHLAKKLYPEGIDIPEADFKKNLEKTKEVLGLGKPLFEPAFMVGNLYSRADILIPVGDEWDILEVKSGTSIKDINIHDVSFQKHVYEKAGLKIRKCFLAHINNKFVKNGEIDPNQILTKEDITSQVEEFIVGIEERIENMINVMKSDLCPDVNISLDCADPYDCPLEDECWGFLPSSSVFDLYNIRKKKAFQWLDDGMQLLTDVPIDLLNDKQGIQHACEKNETVHVNKQELKKFLGSLKEPVNYLDFETFMSAVPVLDGTRPYQQVSFQWSLHVSGKHYEFLASSKDDPREEFLKTLKEVLGDKGTILTYNQSFEIRMLREMALVFPAYKDWVESVVSRVVDLIVPFKTFSYYNPKQKGKCGLKSVLPAIVGKNPYADLNINDGSLALISYLKMTYEDGPDVRADLLKYCELDTEGMIWIVDGLKELTK
ncbi:DUF2779 domain-containing protein [Candidatus Woesearchaeota archaeon]|jgi:hypothetical protein|nr:DUF2779 domain-containing protein [Candidatus Woesearchaeota archaeon]MBT5342714.1 DUF2779 domain-containing protein [Candidatus Woesearchaeota archaeon]